jgi:uncharacterized FlaG/YvyC family protein
VVREGMKGMAIESISTRNTQISADTIPAVFPAKPEDAVNQSTHVAVPASSTSLSVSEAAIQKAAEKINKVLEGSQLKFEYTLHKNSTFVAIKVIDSVTKKVVSEIPSERFFELMAKLPEISGAIFDEKG